MTSSTRSLTTSSQQLVLVFLFVLLMAVTRSHHVAGLHHLPDASWAVFFLAGQHIRRGLVFALLAVLATSIDVIAIGWAGVSDFCVTPAYVMLLPAYAALWLGGRWYARHYQKTLSTLLPLGGAIVLSALAAELFSSGGFYFLGGRFADPTLAGFLPRITRYFPATLGAMTLYISLAALLHTLLAARHQQAESAAHTDFSGKQK